MVIHLSPLCPSHSQLTLLIKRALFFTNKKQKSFEKTKLSLNLPWIEHAFISLTRFRVVCLFSSHLFFPLSSFFLIFFFRSCALFRLDVIWLLVVWMPDSIIYLLINCSRKTWTICTRLDLDAFTAKNCNSCSALLWLNTIFRFICGRSMRITLDRKWLFPNKWLSTGATSFDTGSLHRDRTSLCF